MRVRSLLPLAIVLGAACSDHRDPTAPVRFRDAASARTTVTPAGSLDQNIQSLFELFPKGLGNAGEVRWQNVKDKYAAGQSQPAQLRVAKDMLFELAAWVQQHAGDLAAPPNGETRTAAAARLTLYMAMYVFGSPSTPVPAYLPTADAVVGLVTPTAPDTVVTPTKRAGVQLDAGSVGENTIIVVTENPNPYPVNCSGPLTTKLCQYPRFYNFDEFPHQRLLKPAVFSVCHVNDGALRQPLADHDRFRLAHAKPANPAEYTPGSTVVDSIEILPYAHQIFSTCSHVDYSTAQNSTGMSGMLQRLAHGIGQVLTPRLAYAIDVGGGGFSLDFSPFNDVDPASKPNREVTTVSTSVATTHPGDHITLGSRVANSGSASGAAVLATIRISASPTLTGATTWLDTVRIPAQAPRDTATILNHPIVVPSWLTPGNYYIGLVVDDDPQFPDSTLTDNVMTVPITIDPALGSAHNLSASLASVCALGPGNSVYCWGADANRQLGVAGPDVSQPFAPTTLPAFAQLAPGTSQGPCGIKSDASAVCWGRDGFGQLGRGTVLGGGNAPGAVVGGISWASITVSRLSACGVSVGGAGYCWGSNQHGEVGSATVAINSSTATPHPIDGALTFRFIVAGWLHACGVTTSGSTYCWGHNTYGQLGMGSVGGPDQRSPVLVAGGLQFAQLTLGSINTCGITSDHLAYCWGNNSSGQLGDGTTTNRGAPTPVSGNQRFAHIVLAGGLALLPGPGWLPTGVQGGNGHACALTEAGQAYCWGYNGSGQLGDGTLTDHLTPAPVAGAIPFTSLISGDAFMCGRRANGIWCWGANGNGQLGNGTFINASAPTTVLTPFASP